MASIFDWQSAILVDSAGAHRAPPRASVGRRSPRVWFLPLPRRSRRRLHPPASTLRLLQILLRVQGTSKPTRGPHRREPVPGSSWPSVCVALPCPGNGMPRSACTLLYHGLCTPRARVRPPQFTIMQSRLSGENYKYILIHALLKKSRPSGRPARVRTGSTYGLEPTPARPRATSGSTACQPSGTTRTPRRPLLCSARGLPP